MKILAISSLPTVGNAGLKNVLGILGNKVIPVPTLIISGLANMEGNQRFELPFGEILERSLWMAKKQSYQLIVYTGYMSQASQIDDVANILPKYKDIIHSTIVDPVCGDNGRAYVGRDIIDRFPVLLEKANWAIPNKTEIGLLTHNEMDNELEELSNAFKKRFPNLNYIVTGIIDGDEIGNALHIDNQTQSFSHPYYQKHYSGTGDAFAALFIYYHFIRSLTAQLATQKAGEELASFIKSSIDENKAAHDLNLIIK
ncbi:MAG: bifunctional hydroxymethylpyrimidine kinase/phosphomethylpyrimidine kinase [Bacteroidota bacterium]